jgi:acyl-CoA reductase-like NAD-dependent aldehyde dehydrogenase
VQRGVLDAFLSQLTAALKPLRLGWHDDLEADYSPILKPEVVEQVQAFLAQRQSAVIFGGGVDLARRVIPPTVVLEPSLEEYSFFEFYSPVFRVIPYDTVDELMRFYSQPFQRDLKMGTSVFGGAEIARRLRGRRFVVAHNRTFFDIEDGNKPFGGYGVRASHTQMFGQISAHPVLVSREVMRFTQERERRKSAV